MCKIKNAPISKIRARGMRILWCDVKLLLWRMYGVFRFISIPMCFAAVFGRFTPFFLPVILFMCCIELKLMGDVAHPINAKIEEIKNAKIVFRMRNNNY